jgi:hypothetical protein
MRSQSSLALADQARGEMEMDFSRVVGVGVGQAMTPQSGGVSNLSNS